MHHNGVPQLHVCPTGNITFPNEVEEARVETELDYKKKFESNPVSVG